MLLLDSCAVVLLQSAGFSMPSTCAISVPLSLPRTVSTASEPSSPEQPAAMDQNATATSAATAFHDGPTRRSPPRNVSIFITTSFFLVEARPQRASLPTNGA